MMKKIFSCLLLLTVLLVGFSYAKKPVDKIKIIKGEKGDNGEQGIRGEDGLQGTQGMTGNTLNNQHIGSVGIRLWDCKRHLGMISYGRDFNNDYNIFEAKIIIKLGTSYTDKTIAEQNKRIKVLEEKLGIKG